MTANKNENMTMKPLLKIDQALVNIKKLNTLILKETQSCIASKLGILVLEQSLPQRFEVIKDV